MRSEVGRKMISTINANVLRSIAEFKLRIQAFTEEVREEEKKLPTKEEMQEIFERVCDRRAHEERDENTLLLWTAHNKYR
jgi:hypothetical protein